MRRSRVLRRLALVLVFLTSSLAAVVAAGSAGHIHSADTPGVTSLATENCPCIGQSAILPVECDSSLIEAAWSFIDRDTLLEAPSIASASLTGRLDRDATHVEILLTCGRLLI